MKHLRLIHVEEMQGQENKCITNINCYSVKYVLHRNAVAASLLLPEFKDMELQIINLIHVFGFPDEK